MPAKKVPVPAAENAPEKKAPASDSNLMAAIAELFSLSIIVPLILFFIKKDDKFVRFHALQSTLLGLVVWVVCGVVGLAGVAGGLAFPPLAFVSFCCYPVYGLGVLVALYLAYLAYKGETYKLPLIGNIAMK